jgi:DNA-binding transcriptional MerR regulator
MLRIGELSRRSGVSPELLRAWERRYGLLQPTRSDGGLRLYSADDLERVLRMRGHLAAGLAAAEAAALAQRPDAAATPAPPLPEGAGRRLAAALDRFDEPEAQAIFDRLLATATVESVVVDVVLPYLRELGARWERGEASIAQEHFASAVLRGRLLGLARGWGLGVGPLALLACVPGEQHELGLIAFGLILRARGWRIAYLGADTPIDTVERTAQSLRANVVVLAAVEPGRLEAVADDLRALAAHVPLALGGPGAVAGLGARVLDADLAAAADSLIG